MNEIEIFLALQQEPCVPLVHLNGTGSVTLIRELAKACDAAEALEAALKAQTIHMRDFCLYPGGGHAEFDRAVTQQQARLAAVQLIRAQLNASLEGSTPTQPTQYHWLTKTPVVSTPTPTPTPTSAPVTPPPTPAKPRIAARTALASTLGLDSRELSDYTYQPGRHRPALYCVGGSFFAVGPDKPTFDAGGEWKKHPDQFWAEQAGTTIWEAKETTTTRTRLKS